MATIGATHYLAGQGSEVASHTRHHARCPRRHRPRRPPQPSQPSSPTLAASTVAAALPTSTRWLAPSPSGLASAAPQSTGELPRCSPPVRVAHLVPLSYLWIRSEAHTVSPATLCHRLSPVTLCHRPLGLDTQIAAHRARYQLAYSRPPAGRAACCTRVDASTPAQSGSCSSSSCTHRRPSQSRAH